MIDRVASTAQIVMEVLPEQARYEIECERIQSGIYKAVSRNSKVINQIQLKGTFESEIELN